MRGLIASLLIMFLVRSDMGQDPHQLTFNAQSAAQPASLLWIAAKQGDEVAQQALIDYAVVSQQDYWLNKLVKIGNPDAAWALYQQAGDERSGDRLMKLAAVGNVPEAQLQYAMATDVPEKRETWLLRAANQDYLPAQAALADWYLLHSAPEKARPWLEKTADNDVVSAFHFGRLLWDEGDRKRAVLYLKKAADEGHSVAKALTRMLARYQPVALKNLTPKSTFASECKQRVQLFATSLTTIERAHQYYAQFSQDKRLQALPICMARPLWLEKNELNCADNWKKSGRLGCDVRPLSAAVEALDFTHAVIIAEQGKANVNNGVMFLDMSDTYSVFVHELAHFAGFVDEYPMSSSLAQTYCQRQDAPNLLFDGEITYQPISRLDNWRTLQSAVGLWPAKSCRNVKIKAYKPSGKITFMEHHDSGEIPAIYLKLWQQQLNDPAKQNPVYMNLFQAFNSHGQSAKADIWLQRYNAYRQPVIVKRETATDVLPALP